jgi:hypothetical protein
MENRNRKEFLNAGILGGSAGVPDKRGFRAVTTESIGSPDFNKSYLETFPTAWASAYAFERQLEFEEHNYATDNDALIPATEEWASLLLLHYFGLVHIAEHTRDDIEKNYDKDLWPALDGTYPSSKSGGLLIRLLETNNHTILGGYYPEIIFFPSRNRSAWAEDKTIQSYLEGNKLSWALCARSLLTDDQKKHDFHMHLMRVTAILPGKTLIDRLQHFCEKYFQVAIQVEGKLGKDPVAWDIPGNMPPDSLEYLERYPLKKLNKNGGQTYYLVYGMPHPAPWMTTVVLAGCTPYQYQRVSDTVISVPFRGKSVQCKLNEQDKIVMLKSLFLSDAPYWCKVPRNSDAYTANTRPIHKVELRDPVLTQNEVAICLAPIKREFLEHFPESFANVQTITAIPHLQKALVEWTFPVLGKEIKWESTPAVSTEMPRSSIALWPPKVSRKWKLYVIFGTGTKEASGRWHLIDENGSKGSLLELEVNGAEYISLLQGPGRPNSPKALLLTDSDEKERGILFLADLQEQAIDVDVKAALSVDFGTSNTCLAYKKQDSSSVLKFKLSPGMLWGEQSLLENPGFVPFDWGSPKGFYPTILLSRRSDHHLEELRAESIQIEHLFKIDLPGLHYDMEEPLLSGALDKTWKPHMNMKWDLDNPTPWRSLFLGLSLLYAHAELFFDRNQGAMIDKYIFTFPLAFTDNDRRGFHAEAKSMITRVRQFCYGTDPLSDKLDGKYIDNIDESTAVASSAWIEPASTTMEVFIDVGGGTGDIAIRHGESYLVLDSIRVAGSTFFRFAKKNFDPNFLLKGASEFKKDLLRILSRTGNKDNQEFELKEDILDFNTYYSLSINRLTDEEFRRREAKVLEGGKGTSAFQPYRSLLFFRHILAYALLQACAAVIDKKIRLEDGIKLILSGNAWGLMVFADLPRSQKKLNEEAKKILSLLKAQLIKSVDKEDFAYLEALKIFRVELLNEEDLSKAKTGVALGALNADSDSRSILEEMRPYTGITLKGLRINKFAPFDVQWSNRWGFEEFKEKAGAMDQITAVKFEEPKSMKTPLDSVLSIFTALGNVSRNDEDNMPQEVWADMNAALCRRVARLEGNRLGPSPINFFLSTVLYPQDGQRDFLDTLAEENGNFKTERR